MVRRQTGRHHAPGPTPRTQFLAKDGTYVCALVAGRLNPRYVRDLADPLDSYGMAGDLKDPKYQDPAVIAASTSHIIDDLVANFIASPAAEEVYHAAQQRGFTWGAVRAPEALVEDAHLHDRGFWKAVEHPELGRSFVYPGEAAIYKRLALADLQTGTTNRRAQHGNLLRRIRIVSRGAIGSSGKSCDLVLRPIHKIH